MISHFTFLDSLSTIAKEVFSCVEFLIISMALYTCGGKPELVKTLEVAGVHII